EKEGDFWNCVEESRRAAGNDRNEFGAESQPKEVEESVVIEQLGVVEVPGPCYRIIPAVVTTAVGQMLAMAGVFGVGFVDCLLLVHKAW
ncbi:hypothetical protein ABKV19_012655, partial [Rosa sericea]